MAPRTILLKGRGIAKEGKAGEVITPGHLIERNSAGNLIKHATAGEKTMPMFAKENELAGDEIATTYALNDNVLAEVVPPGAEIYALVPASAVAIVIGDLLESNGDGTLRKIVPPVDLTDSTTGTANDTVVDVGGAFTQATLNDNFADVIAKINALLPAGVQSGAICRALEAVDNSGGGSEARIQVEVL